MQITINDKVRYSKRVLNDQGHLVVSGSRIARTGIQEYFAFELGLTDREPTDIVKLYRPPEEVFNDSSMASFQNVPVTDNHPPELINDANAKGLTRGVVGSEVRQDGIFLVADSITITDSEMIEKIGLGKTELSNGYTSLIDFTSGVTPDTNETYDAIQTNIKGNHLAIVDEGRCGKSCKISDHKTGVPKMALIKINGVEFEVTDSVAQAFGVLTEQHNTALADSKKSSDTLQAKLDDSVSVSKKESDTLQAKLDDALDNAMTPEKLDALIDSRVQVLAVASKVIENFDGAGKTCMDVKREVIAASSNKEIILDGKSDDYVNARFESIEDALASGTSNTLTDAMKKHSEKEETEIVDSEKSRQAFIDKNKDRFKS